MADLPNASVVIDDTANAFAGSTGFLVVMAAVSQNADATPRVFASTKALLDEHGYAPGVDYCALHFQATRKPVIFMGLPIVTAGAIGRQNNSGVTGSSVISVSAGSGGILEETDASVEVLTGGTIGQMGITLAISLDGGKTTKNVRLGTSNSYTIPYVGIVLNFGAGTLNAGDVYTFSTTAPLWDSAGLTAARTALAAQQKLARSWLVVGDVSNSTDAGYIVTEANAYETANQRFIYARAQVRDRLPLAVNSSIKKTMSGTPNITFDGTAHTITRSAGSFLTDGFAVGDFVTVAGASDSSNNGGHKITAVTATVMTFASGLADEGPEANITITGSSSLVFSSSAHTITRVAGSWLNDGFAVGDSVTIGGTSSNDSTHTISTLTSTVMTFASGLADETIGSATASVTKGETVAAWVAAMDSAMSTIDAQKRIDLGLGRARVASPISGWQFRRPVQWAVSIREYSHDVQIPTWRKSDGPLDGWSLTDENGNTVEFDDRYDGGGLEARFTCLRSYGNGPVGAYVALSLTRDSDGSLLSRTHNMAVANLACTTVQAETENAIGQVLELKSDGTATDDSLGKIEERVNSSLQINLLQAFAEGPRASHAVWTANHAAVLNVPSATLDGTLELELNGTLEKINTRVRVQTAGA